MEEPILQTRDDMWFRLNDVMEQMCNSDEESDTMMDDLADQARDILVGTNKNLKENNFQDLEECFNTCEQNLSDGDKGKEFEIIQAFIFEEQNLGKQRRKDARRIEATEERRLAGEIAALKGFRLKSQAASTHSDLHQKIADAERAYLSRKMSVAKSAQMANSECRLHFTRVREFFEELQTSRKDSLRRQYLRSLKIHAVTHRLHKTDARVVALERQIINRLYHKKKTDLNELHMTQNMEEAMYLETMLELLYKVQLGKESAARELFELHVKYLKEQRNANSRRTDELQDLRTTATMEMAKVIAHYTEEEDDNREAEEQVRENVDSMERRKDFNSSLPILSVSQLYDAVLWSVATSDTSAGSTLISSSDYDGTDLDEEEEQEDPGLDEQEQLESGTQSDTLLDADDESQSRENWKKDERDFGSDTASMTQDGSSVRSGNSGTEDKNSRISLLGKIHVKQLSKEYRLKEKEVLKTHEAEMKSERRKYRVTARILRKKHQHIVDGLLQKCLYERHMLREAIGHRMITLAKNQDDSTRQLRKVIENDIKVMQEALRSEDQRLEDAEKTSFIKAQEMISSQVFHEVRNALSSMISMSEMTSSLKNDASLSPSELVCAVDDMLEQIKEVVHYSLNMLNNILDVSKIKSGSFVLDSKEFDLQELVARATKMQLSKAGGRVKMTFLPDPKPCIANTDSDIVVRIVTNFISNAIKFTSAGAIQPFVWSLDDMFPHDGQASICDSSVTSSEQSCLNDTGIKPAGRADKHFLTPSGLHERLEVTKESAFEQSLMEDEHEVIDVKHTDRKRMFAIGVADSGRGLSKEMLRLSERGLLTSESGSMVSCVRNSGFGLHLAHLLAEALGSRLHLTSLEKCRHLLNEDMIHAMDGYHHRSHDRHGNADKEGTYDFDSDGAESVSCLSSKSGCPPGSGTVLYITLPLYEEKALEEEDPDFAVDSSGCHVSVVPSAPMARVPSYVFSPRPCPSSQDGTFRVLVADDVKMLRKGLVHGLMQLFPDSPLSICTACTAEDVLRATSSEPFDLVICDNQFLHNPVSLRPLTKEAELVHGRPRLFFDSQKVSQSEVHKLINEFFENECFTLRGGDGALSGYEALKQLAESKTPPFHTPILTLLSGHKFDVPPSPGVIVVQKPLNRAGFAPLLEAHAMELVRTGFCTEQQVGNDNDKEDSEDSAGTTITHGRGGDDPSKKDVFDNDGCNDINGENRRQTIQHSSILVNRHGTQIFALK